jgi:hypothetical protein
VKEEDTHSAHSFYSDHPSIEAEKNMKNKKKRNQIVSNVERNQTMVTE